MGRESFRDPTPVPQGVFRVRRHAWRGLQFLTSQNHAKYFSGHSFPFDSLPVDKDPVAFHLPLHSPVSCEEVPRCLTACFTTMPSPGGTKLYLAPASSAHVRQNANQFKSKAGAVIVHGLVVGLQRYPRRPAKRTG